MPYVLGTHWSLQDANIKPLPSKLSYLILHTTLSCLSIATHIYNRGEKYLKLILRTVTFFTDKKINYYIVVFAIKGFTKLKIYIIFIMLHLKFVTFSSILHLCLN